MVLASMALGQSLEAQDWANTDRYRDANAQLGLPEADEKRVVFMGNSITEGWSQFCPDFFAGKPYINRGISGQTTPQMLVRFQSDVIALKPAVVVILAGTNDIAGNTGPASLQTILENITSMAELATAHGIRVVISSVLPAFDYPWRPGLQPDQKIPALNALLQQLAQAQGHTYLDYFSVMADEQNGLLKTYTYDGVHPNEAGYRFMAPLAEVAIARALSK